VASDQLGVTFGPRYVEIDFGARASTTMSGAFHTADDRTTYDQIAARSFTSNRFAHARLPRADSGGFPASPVDGCAKVGYSAGKLRLGVLP
jgi:hypothetical protein